MYNGLYKGDGVYNGFLYNTKTVYNGGGGFPPLPPEYQALKYIECDLNTGAGAQIVGVSPSIAYDDTISLSCEFLQPIQGYNWLYFFYTWTQNERSFKLEGTGQRAYHRWNATTTNEQQTFFSSGPLELICSKSICKMNGVYYPTNTGPADSPKGLGRIFHFNIAQACRAYTFDVFDSDGNSKSHLVPAKRIIDGVLGFYDVIAANFRRNVDNLNSGWIIPGPEL